MKSPYSPHVLGAWCGTLLTVSSASAQTTITTLDSVGTVGRYSDIAYGPDGLALISYQDETNWDLKVAHCQDVACTAASLATLDSTGFVGRFTSIAFGSDGLGLISYYDSTNGQLKVAHCIDAACSAATISVLESISSLNGTALAIGTDGLGIVAYDKTQLTVAHCLDASCTQATPTTFPGVYADAVAITIGGDGLPLVVAGSSLGLWVGHCQNVACAAAAFTGYGQGPSGWPEWASIATGAGGHGVLGVQRAYYPPPPPNPPIVRVSVAPCANAACSSLTGEHGLSPTAGDYAPAVAVLPDGRPIVAYRHDPGSGPAELRLARCATPLCAGATLEVVDANSAGYEPSVAISPEGGALISYQGASSLKVAYVAPGAAPGTADLSLSMTDSPDPVNPREPLTYTLSVTNNGPQTATGVFVTDSLPAGLYDLFQDAVACGSNPVDGTVCALGDIPVGESRLVSVGGYPEASELTTLNNQASVSSTGNDPNPANDTASATTSVNPWLLVVDAAVAEGTGGNTDLLFPVLLSRPSSQTVAVDYRTLTAGTATSGVDYLATTGTLTFAPGTVVRSFAVPVVGDTLIEEDETFNVVLENAQGAGFNTASMGGYGDIVDDDAPPLSQRELVHGSTLSMDLGPGNAQAGVAHFRVASAPYSSYEVVVDAVSPDAAPISIARLAGDGHVLGTAGGTGGSASLSWTSNLSVPVVNQHLRVTAACGAACDAGDRYRIRLYETTVFVPRFSNVGGQRTVLIVQNPMPDQTLLHILAFDEAGWLLQERLQTFYAHSTFVWDTSAWQDLLVGRSGTVRILSWQPYGTLQAKAVILDPATGLNSEVSFSVRPR